MPFILLISLIIIHELGHFLCALFFKINVDKIYIYPFGGISKFDISLNENLFKELLILIMGPIFQIVFYLILIRIHYFNSYISIITIYHYTILFFNLLPIYPLDGGKLLNIILCFHIPFKKSLTVSLIFSYITICFLSIYMLLKDFSINILVIISFLIYKVDLEVKKKNYVIDKFLLERYLKHYHFKKRKEVSSSDDFMKNKSHIIKVGNKYYTERDFLNHKFNK